MGSPCEVLVETSHEQLAQAVTGAVAACARRIEQKFSRYRTDNIIAQINTAAGRPVEVDEETARLLDFAELAWQLSAGKFDITSGALRRAWQFDGGSRIPSTEEVQKLLVLVGWSRVRWNRPWLELSPGMEIDLGGIGKEYAVDQALAAAAQLTSDPVLVNFGGDLAATGPRRDGQPWRVGIEGVGAPAAARLVDLSAGALATSGDTYRFVSAAGQRLPHILDPRSGTPVRGAPRSVTVAAPTCTQAGLWCTLAMLEGAGAEAFLQRELVRYWVQR
ncbi:MAG TPA: FAD:protein FMN transferase [Steroidobacteraceae bacterium]|nr:FAD:protein FMN transferase [Steroidobacteraceae bacterium]